MIGEGVGARLPAGTGIGCVRLRVADLNRVLPVYRDAIGLDVERDGSIARAIAGGDVLVEFESSPDRPDRGDRAGLFHLAIRVPDRTALGGALGRLRDHGVLTGASDHRVSEALYLRDPEGNGVEVYQDRPRSSWPRTPDGGVGITTEPLDLDALAAAGDPGDGGVPAGTDVGHVHLEGTDLRAAEAFYVDALGFDVQARYGDSAIFLGADGYHHHVGVNTWNARARPAGDTLGLVWFELTVSPAHVDAVLDRARADGYPVESLAAGGAVRDPDAIEVRVVPDGE